jgi:hypothetical protein
MLISDEKKSTARAIGDSSYRVAGLASSENSTSFFPIVVFFTSLCRIDWTLDSIERKMG